MKQSKKSGLDWARIMNVTVFAPRGWSSENQFNSQLITKQEFCNRAANSGVQANATHPVLVSVNPRRSAAKMLKKI